MKVYVQKQSQPQQKPSLHPSSFVQHKILNQVVPVSSHADAEERKEVTSTAEPSRFAHDFSRIPAYSNAPVSLQAKLKVSTPGDIYEQEADRVSELMTSMSEPQLQRTCACGGGCPTCRNEQAAHERLQTHRVEANDSGGVTAPPIVNEVLHSSGQPLDSSTRAFMESRFGHDFSHVRVHADTRAAESAQAVNALAYTVGRDLVFGPGHYRPASTEGRKLLAHELTHVVQQRPGFEASKQTGTLLAQRQPTPKKNVKSPSAKTDQSKSTPTQMGDDPALLHALSLEELGQLYAATDIKSVLTELQLDSDTSAHFTVAWVKGAGRKLIQDELSMRVDDASEKERITFSTFIDSMHAKKFDATRKAWLRGLIDKSLPLTQEERAELRRVVGDRMNDAYTDFSGATAANANAIKAAVAAHAAMVSLIFDVFMGLAAPGLSKGISVLASLLPIKASNLAYRVALKALDQRNTERLFAAATKVGKESIKMNATALFGETDTDLFLRGLKSAFRKSTDAVNLDLPNRTDEELGVLAATYDPSVSDEAHYIPVIQDLISRFQKQIRPIGKAESAGVTDPMDRTVITTTGIAWAQVGFAKYLVQIEVRNVSGGTRDVPTILKFVTFIDTDFKDAAIDKANATQPKGIQTIPSSIIVDFPSKIPSNAVLKK